MILTFDDLVEYKADTLKNMKILYDPNENLYGKLEGVGLGLIGSPAPEGVWYGYADFADNKVMVYEQNISHVITKDPRRFIEREKMSPDMMNKILLSTANVQKDKLFSMVNQSGMDQILGHFYNYFSNAKNDSRHGYQAEIDLAELRAEKDVNWDFIAFLLPLALKHHKGFDVS